MEEPYKNILLFIFILLYPLVFIYLQQRARNKADLAFKSKLTKIEESIKTVNALQIDRGKQIFSEEKDSIIVFFAQLNTWIWKSLNINLLDYHSENFEEIFTRIKLMQKELNKTNIAYAKIMLVVNNDELVMLGQEAINKTFEVYQFRENLLNRLSTPLEIIHLIKEHTCNRELEITEINSEVFKNYMKQSRLREVQRNEIISEFKFSDATIFNSAIEAVNAFKKSAQTHLRKKSLTN